MANQIPTKQREALKKRAQGRCERCGGPGLHWHHRRSRSVIDQHTHCMCNGVLLCNVCHSVVHLHPRDAREEGFIVSRHAQPWTEPMNHIGGLRLPACDGGWV